MRWRTGVAVVKVRGADISAVSGWSPTAGPSAAVDHAAAARVGQPPPESKAARPPAKAIRSMLVRGAPLIGATAAYGVALAMRLDGSDMALDRACKR